ncbi:response regulator [Draconibacterium sp. IB214405]|uniref:response regulator n=1 Tax=Draconibacterium sp. IB214405 TaxID=3097352 RepID=UPI002A0E40EF|nr:response regulator [Draconibacterium sp. IB214405]MDX8339871.1 response regulator [Draconibacterium sp. IB214405]
MSEKQKIFYVDDEPINLLLFESNFKKIYEVLTAPDGSEGLKVLDEHPDIMVIISDMKMPGMNGIEFITKAKEKFPNKKFFILTGFEITDEIRAALDSGLILEYFSKPFDVKRMHSIIADALVN